MKIEFFRHNISETDITNVNKVLRSIFLTTGKTVDEFEKELAKYLDCKYAIGLTSCTAALQLSLEALGVGNGDEVITTPMSFVATADAILQAGATPVFVDVEETTGNIDVNLIEKAITKKTKAIMPVHLYGQMCDMKKMRKIADKHNLKIVEDAAHCLEGRRDGVRPGELGDTACLSFYATKSITCGEGGAVITNDSKIAGRIRRLRLHGLNKSASERYHKKFYDWDVKTFGWKYNMDNIQAALLSHQLKMVDVFWKKRAAVYRYYENLLKGCKNFTFPRTLANTKHGYHLFTLWITNENREKAMKYLDSVGVPVQINYRPIHLMTFFKEKYGYGKGDFRVAEKIGASSITLPLYPKLKKNEILYIVDKVRRLDDLL